MHFDFGQEPAGVTDRMIVFERFAGEYEISSGEVLGVQVKCAVLLERVPSDMYPASSSPRGGYIALGSSSGSSACQNVTLMSYSASTRECPRLVFS